MAKAPSAKVAKTSGQGVSRLSYQKGRSLGNRGTASPGDTPSISLQSSSQKTDYGKTGKVKYPAGINVSYGDTYEPTDLKDIQALGQRTPPKGFKNTRMKGKTLK